MTIKIKIIDTKTILILSIIGLVIAAAGCIGNDQYDKNKDIEDHVSINIKASGDTTKWCVPGDKITIHGMEFTITGISKVMNGKEICEADSISNNQGTIHEFSEDGSIDIEKSYNNADDSSRLVAVNAKAGESYTDV